MRLQRVDRSGPDRFITQLFLLSLLPLAIASHLTTPGHPTSETVLRDELPDTKSLDGVGTEFTLHSTFFYDINNTTNGVVHVTAVELNQLVTAPNDIKPLRPATFSIASTRWPAPPLSEGSNVAGTDQTARVAPMGPDVSDRATVINLAKMASDAYVFAPTQPDWLNTTLKFNYSSSFGWEKHGLRGHVFTDRWSKTVIVSFKGTTIDPREDGTANDRLNDNILFSCCCGDQRPDPYPYSPVCGCRSDTYTCNATCITQELGQKDRYYASALAVMYNVTAKFPDADFWVVGHSMGGAMASLMGLTFGLPAVTFEAPGDQLAAVRLGLSKKHSLGAYHFGNTADPVYMGACNGWTSSCGIAGYAFESQCFTGKRCVYDTVGDFGWHLNIGNHRINTVITEVLEKYNHTAKCDVDEECVDCYNWKSSGA